MFCLDAIIKVEVKNKMLLFIPEKILEHCFPLFVLEILYIDIKERKTLKLLKIQNVTNAIKLRMINYFKPILPTLKHQLKYLTLSDFKRYLKYKLTHQNHNIFIALPLCKCFSAFSNSLVNNIKDNQTQSLH
jgi:hypothetical protein